MIGAVVTIIGAVSLTAISSVDYYHIRFGTRSNFDKQVDQLQRQDSIDKSALPAIGASREREGLKYAQEAYILSAVVLILGIMTLYGVF